MTNKIVSSPTFLTHSLGCRTNQAEINNLETQLINQGFLPFSRVSMYQYMETSKNEPDLILVNTCAVTLKAERESRKAIRHFKGLYPKAKIVSLGCAAKSIKDADLSIENLQKPKAMTIIFKGFGLTPPRCQAKYPTTNTYHASGRALVKIQEGCDQSCTYCIVPYLRGKPKSAPSKEIICQINKLVEQGIKEIILCGINLSLYGKDLTPPSSLTTLIKKVLSQTRAERISLSSINPETLLQDLEMNPGQNPSLKKLNEFTRLIVNNPRINQCFHLSLQSGSQVVLERMNRKDNLKKLLKILRLIKQKCPEFTFRADIIVGFPGESEKNFQETLDFIKKAPISFCHVFPYSARTETLAAKMIAAKQWHDLPMSIKKERAKKVMELTKQIQKEEAKKLIGKILPCLIVRKISGGYEAIANNSWMIKIRSMNNKLRTMGIKGKILPIKINYGEKNYLGGEILSFPTYD